MSLARRALAEFAGTATLVAVPGRDGPRAMRQLFEVLTASMVSPPADAMAGVPQAEPGV